MMTIDFILFIYSLLLDIVSKKPPMYLKEIAKEISNVNVIFHVIIMVIIGNATESIATRVTITIIITIITTGVDRNINGIIIIPVDRRRHLQNPIIRQRYINHQHIHHHRTGISLNVC